MNILIEKQSVPEHGDFKSKSGMKHRSMTLWDGLRSENKEVA